MNESPVKLSENPVYAKIHEPASSASFHILENTNQTEKSGHSSDDHCNRYEVNPLGGSKRAFFALVIFVGLISLLVLVLTVLKFGSSNEGQFTDLLMFEKTRCINHRVIASRTGTQSHTGVLINLNLGLSYNQTMHRRVSFKCQMTQAV